MENIFHLLLRCIFGNSELSLFRLSSLDFIKFLAAHLFQTRHCFCNQARLKKKTIIYIYIYIFFFFFFFLRLLLSFSHGKHSSVKQQKVISSRYACHNVSKLYTLLIYNNIFSPAQPGIFLFSTNDKSENVFEYSSIIASGMSYCG